MKRALLAALGAAALALLAVPAKAYVRSKTDAGICLYWANPSGVPVVANVTSGPTAGGCASSNDVDALVRTSTATWSKATRTGESQPCTSFSFGYQGATTSIDVGFDNTAGAHNDNLIVFRHGLCDGNPDCGGSGLTTEQLEACADRIGCWPHDTLKGIATSRTIAITTTSYIPSGSRAGEIVDADMELFDRGGTSDPGYFFTCPDQSTGAPYCGRDVSPSSFGSPCISTDLGSILTHESGHMLGLDHTPVSDATMFASYTPGSTKLRTLAADDISGVCSAYPAGGAPTNCSASVVPPVTQQPKSSGGCSTAGGGVISMIGVGLALARRRRSSTP